MVYRKKLSFWSLMRCTETRAVFQPAYRFDMTLARLVVLESGLGLESGLKSVFAKLGLRLESYGLGLGLGLGGSASKSFFQVLCTYKIDSSVTDYFAVAL